MKYLTPAPIYFVNAIGDITLMQNRSKTSLPLLILSMAAIIIMLPIALAFMLVMFLYLLVTKKKLKKDFSKYFNQHQAQQSQHTDKSSQSGRTIDHEDINK